ncbi:PH domain-containing protein DDB_G0267786-like [Porites lutea]|uniref:PH domain-containing protein DDB_G0267786-like n=1 Tax=Porites lutea TaxID=51062 RepID=UPI003CC61E23
MGNLLPLDSSKKQQIEDIAEEFLKEFTIAYNTAYGVEYTKKTLKEIDADSFAEEKPVYKLSHRPWDTFKSPLRMGYLTKKGAVVKNWKRRYFVAKADYSVDYYESEEAYEKGFKPKGTIFPCGYEVNANVDETMAERLKNLAKMMGVDENEVGAPEKLPEHTFEVGHDRRRSYLITAENEEDKQAWVETFKICCRKAKGLKSEDPVGRAAFKTAIWKTYWRHRVTGTEEQVLSDILVDRINYRVMTSVYYEIKGGWTMRQKIREQVVKTLDSLVMAMVIPSWKGMQESSQQMKTVLEPTIKDKKDELAAVQRKVMWDLSELLKSAMEKFLTDMKDTMKEIVELLKPKMEQGLTELRKIFIKTVDKVIEEAESTNEVEASLPSFFKTLDYVPRSASKLYDAVKCVASASDLRKYDDRINKLNGYIVRDIGSDALAQLLDSAMFTFEERFNEGITGTDANTNGQTAADVMKVVKEEVLLKFDVDKKVALDEYLMSALMSMLVPHTHSLADEVCKPMIKPVEQSIPDPLRQAISLSDKYDTYVETSIRDTIKKVCGVGRASATQAEAKKESTAEPAKSGEPKAEATAKESEQKSSEPKAEETAKESEQKPSEPKAEETAKESEQKPSEPEAEETEKEPEQKPSEEPKAEEKSSEGGEKPAEPEGETEEPKAEQTTEL